MGKRPGQRCKSHNKHAGSHGSFDLISKYDNQHKKHHHSAAGAHNAADESHDHTADNRLDGRFLFTPVSVAFFGFHDGPENKFQAHQQRHEHGETTHGCLRKKRGQIAAHKGENQYGYQHD